MRTIDISALIVLSWLITVFDGFDKLGPVVGAAVLASGLPILRSYALLAVCPAIVSLCALGIHRVARARNSQPHREA